MQLQRLYFAIPESLATQALSGRLHAALPLSAGRPQTLTQVWLDSFDWRLHGAGQPLWYERDEQGLRLLWQAPGQPLWALEREAPPRFAADLPAGPLRDTLAPVLEMRALLPRVELVGERLPLRLLDGERKTVVRLDIESLDLQQGDGQRRPLGRWLALEGVRGYPEAYAQVFALLEGLDLRPDGGPFHAGFGQSGLHPGDYSSKVQIPLDPAEPAWIATRRILRHLHQAMQVNEPGTRADLDSEFLHDYRVAVRRTRSALGQIKGVLPEGPTARFKEGFAWLGQETGPTRDLDVYLLTFDAYQARLPSAVRADLDPLYAYLVAHQRQSQQALVAALDTPRYAELQADWAALLEGELGKRVPEQALIPIGELASRRIWKMYRRVLDEGRAISPSSPPAALHELRKSCKKLRYLMEFFAALYPAETLKGLIKALKTLQENLGDFQDFEVQQHALHGFAEAMFAEGLAGPATLLAMGMLMRDLEQRQHAAREAFANRFASFAMPQYEAQFRALFVPSTDKSTPTSP